LRVKHRKTIDRGSGVGSVVLWTMPAADVKGRDRLPRGNGKETVKGRPAGLRFERTTRCSQPMGKGARSVAARAR